MPATATKRQILGDAGYAYSFDRMIYLNRDARKAFSVEFVEDHSEGELEARIQVVWVSREVVSQRQHAIVLLAEASRF